LTTAVVLAQHHDVTVVEIDSRKVNEINHGVAPFYEEGLEDLLNTARESGRLECISPDDHYGSHDFVIICVGTPPSPDGSVDLRFLSMAVDQIGSRFDELVDQYLVVAVRSTVPPGTTRGLVLEALARNHPTNVFGVVFNPEFMRQGRAIHDIQFPDRFILGASDKRASESYKQLYSSVFRGLDVPIMEMSLESAELCKYASNSFLATKVSFANEIASIAERIRYANVDDVLRGMVADRRICPSHLKAGLGFGGTCLPKDLLGLMTYGLKMGLKMNLLQAVARVNDDIIARLMHLIVSHIPDLRGKKVAVLGLTFKSGTDDTRKSQSLDLIARLVSEGAEVWAHDPMANEYTIPREIRGSFTRANDVRKCTENASVCVLMTDWPVYREMGLEQLTTGMRSKIFIDGRRLFANARIPEDITYRCLGSYSGPALLAEPRLGTRRGG